MNYCICSFIREKIILNIIIRMITKIQRPSSRNSTNLYYSIIIFLIVSLVSSKHQISISTITDSEYQKIFYVDCRESHFFVSISCKQKDMLSVMITPQLKYQEAPRFPIHGNLKNIPNMAKHTFTLFHECPVNIQIQNDFYIEIRRKDTGSLLLIVDSIQFQKLKNKFVVKDYSTKWGFGQRFQSRFDIKDGNWTIWNRDKPWKIDHGKNYVSQQTYGHHPVYLARQKVTHLYHLVYFKNCHGMRISSLQQSDKLIFNTIGGNIHLIIITGGQNPQPVIEQYHSYIGHSHIPPFWSLGFHQSRWGYYNFGYIEQVIKQYKDNGLPLDCVWADLDYMKQKRIFTINQATFPPKDIEKIMTEHQLRFIPLLDVAVAIDDLQAVNLGIKMDVFLRDNLKPKQYYVGEVWPGKVYYIDYLHPNSSQFWKIQLNRLNKKLNFSGIWLDMNEPTNFKGGAITEEPLAIQYAQSINTMTIDVNLKHYCERQEQQQLFHREVHSYYGHLSSVPTFEYLQQKGRPFIISRSTGVGTGIFAGHWTGDNVANWEFLRLSISGNFLFQIFGIQMVGADICGFYEDTTQQLCSRWMQLGSFYPFARNHNHQKAIDQQPYQMGPTLLQTSRICLKTRYSLLKQLYTIIVSKKGKGSIFRPLSFQFFYDEYLYNQEIIETQFLFGSSLMIAPIVEQFAQERNVYFPGLDEDWYEFRLNIRQGFVNQQSINWFISNTQDILLNQLPSPPLMFLRGGSLIFTNKPQQRSQNLSNRFHIFAALKNGNAQGQILGIANYNNDNAITNCIQSGCFYHFILTKDKENLYVSWRFQGDEQQMANIYIQSIVITEKNMKFEIKSLFLVGSSTDIIHFPLQLNQL